MRRIAAIILAAGQASRFRAAAGEAGPATKLVAQLDGKPLVRHVAEAALASRAAQGEIVEVAVASRAVTFDVDTPDALGAKNQGGTEAAPHDQA